MRARKLISLFFIKLVIVYLLFVTAWEATPVSRYYAATFRSVGTWFFNALSFGEHGRIRLGELNSPNNLWDSNLYMHNQKTDALGTLPFSSHGWGYAPTAMVATLILATPIPWRNRVRAMFWGMLLVHAWIALEVFLAAVNAFSQQTSLALYHPHPLVARCLAYATEVVTKSTVTRYAISTVIWAAVAFTRQDRELLQSALTDRNAKDNS